MDHRDTLVFLKLASFVTKNSDRDKMLKMDHRDTLVFLKLASFVNKIMIQISC
jgi:hypothetical protein